jgi:peptide/nickel transport system substrate-binding protein
MTREELVLIANKDYYEGPPKIEKVIYKTISDSDTQVMGLVKGEIDYIIEVPSDQSYVDRVKAGGAKTKGIDHGGYHQLLINTSVAPLNDVRVRKAIAHAIDKDEIIKTLYVPGAVEKLGSLCPRGYWGYTEEGLPRYNFDPKRARELLSEAGFPNGFDITMDSSNHPAYVRLATAIQAQLTSVGIRLKLDVTDEPTWLKKVTGGTARLSLFLPSRAPDADTNLTRFFHSSGFSPGYNLSHYDKLDKELDEARGEMNPTRRLKMYQEIQKRLMEDLPAVPLFNVRDVAAYRSTLSEIPERDPIWGIDYSHVTLNE